MITEGFPTYQALVGFFPSVYPPVHVQVRAYAEGFTTVITLIGFFSRVTSHVCLEGRLVAESLPTLPALHTFLYKVNAHVLPPGQVIPKDLSTGATFIPSLLGVYFPVGSEVRACTEGFPTQITSVGFLSSVGVHVCLED